MALKFATSGNRGLVIEPLPSKIYLDCTATVNNGLNTGIQRVVRKLIQHSKEAAKDINVPIIPVVYLEGSFQKINFEGNAQLVNLSKKFASEEKLRLVYFRSKVWLNAKLNQPGLRWIFTLFFAAIEKVKFMLLYYFNRKRLNSFRTALTPIQFSSTDVLVLADSWWANGVSEGAQKLRQAVNLKVITLIYDFIPMSHPELTAVHTTQEFSDNLKIVSQVSDSYIGISKFVRDEIKKYIPTAKSVDYFYLGGDFAPAVANSDNYIRQWHPQIAKGSFFLVVSTIEPRKGHGYILQAFEQHWKSGGQAVLCMVGRIGSGVDELASRILNHQEKDKKLFNFFNVNDLELQELYAKSKALIFASKIEGFGLPLVEAMEKGRPILASDIAIFREICGDYANYFSLDNPEQLGLLLSADLDSHKKPVQWMNWQQSSEMFFRRVVEAYRH